MESYPRLLLLLIVGSLVWDFNAAVTLSQWQLDMNTGTLTLEIQGTLLINITNLDCSQITIANGNPYTRVYNLSGCHNQQLLTMVSVQFSLTDSDFQNIKVIPNMATGNTDTFMSINVDNGIVDSMNNTELAAIPLNMAVQVSHYQPDVTGPGITNDGFVLFDLDKGLIAIQFDEPVDLITLFGNNTVGFQFTETFNGSSTMDTYVVQSSALYNVNIIDYVTLKLSISHTDLNNIKANTRLCTAMTNCWLFIADPNQLIEDTAGNGLSNNTLNDSWPVQSFVDDTTGPLLESFLLDLDNKQIILSFDEPIAVTNVYPSGIIVLSSPGENDSSLLYELQPDGIEQSDVVTVNVSLSNTDLSELQIRPNLATDGNNTYLSFTTFTAVVDKSCLQNRIQPTSTDYPIAVTSIVPDNSSPQLVGFDLDLNRNEVTLYFDEPVLIGEPYFMLEWCDLNGNGSIIVNRTEHAQTFPWIVTFPLSTDVCSLKFVIRANNSYNIFISSPAGLVVDTNNNPSNEISNVSVLNIIMDTTPVRLVSFTLDMNTGVIIMTFDDAVQPTSVLPSSALLLNNQRKLYVSASYINSSDSYILQLWINSAELFRLKQIVSVAANVQNTVITITQSFVRDAFDNDCVPISCNEPLRVSTFIVDLTAPYVRNFTLDLNEGLLIVHFSEVVDIASFSIFGNIFSSGYQLFNSIMVFPTHPYDQVFVSMSDNDHSMFIELGNISDIISNISLAVDVLDMAGNMLIPFSLENSSHLVTFIADITSFKLQSFSLDMNTGMLILTFSKAVNASTLRVSGITFLNRYTQFRSTANYTLTDSYIWCINETVIEAVFDVQDFNAIAGNRELATSLANTFMLLSYCAIMDVDGNCILETSPLQATHYARDETPVYIYDFSLDLSADHLDLSFSEAVVAASLDPTQITLQNTSNGSGSSYTLTGGTPLSDPNDVSILSLLLAQNDLNAIKLMEHLATNINNTYMSYTSKTIRDMAGNNVVALNPVTALWTASFSSDTAPPNLSEAYLDFQTTQGVLSLIFNEPVILESFNISGIAIQDRQSDPNVTLTLTSGVISSNDSVVIEIAFTDPEFDQIKSLYDLTNGSVFITVDSSTVSDIRGNFNNAVVSSSAFPVTQSHQPFELLHFYWYTETGFITLIFSEEVNVSTFMLSQLTLQDWFSCPTEIYTLTRSSLASDSENGRTVGINLTTYDLNVIKSNLQLAKGRINTFISATELLVVSFTGKKLTQVHISNALLASVFVYDLSFSQLKGFDFEYSNGILILLFDEPVILSSVNVTAIRLYSSPTPSAKSYQLTDSYTIDNVSADVYVRVQLNDFDFNNIKALNICVHNDVCYLTVTSDLAVDTSRNANWNEPISDPLNVSYYILSNLVQQHNNNISNISRQYVTHFNTLDLNRGTFTIESSVPLSIVDLPEIGLFSLSTGDHFVSIDFNSITLFNTSTNQLSHKFQISLEDLNAVKRKSDLCTSNLPSNCYIKYISLSINRLIPQFPSLSLQEFIFDTTNPILLLFSFNMNSGLLTFIFDEVIDLFCINTTLITFQNAPSSPTVMLSPRLLGSMNLSIDGLVLQWLLDPVDVTMLKAEEGLFTSINTSYLTYFEFVADVSGNFIRSRSSNNGLLANNYFRDIASPMLVSFFELNFDNGSICLVFNEPISNVRLQQFVLFEINSSLTTPLAANDSVTIANEVQLSGGTYVYVTEQKKSIIIEFNKNDLRNIRLLPLNGSVTYLSFTSNALTDTSANLVVPVYGMLPAIFIPDTSNPVFLYSILDMNTGNLTIEFDDVINSSTINPNVISISNGQGRSYTLSAFYPVNLFQSDCRIYISFELSDLNAIKRDSELATELSNSYIIFSEYVAQDLDGRNVIGMAIQSPTQVISYMPDISSPSLVSFNLDLDNAILVFTFDEPVLLSSYNPSGISVQNAEECNPQNSEYFHDHILTGGDILVENVTGAEVVTIVLSRLDLSALQVLNNHTVTVDSLYVIISPTAFIDVSGVSVANNLAVVVTNFINDASNPLLVSFDLNLINNTLILRFSEAVVLQTFVASGITLLSQPTSTPHATQLNVNGNSGYYSIEFNSTIVVRLTLIDQQFLNDPDLPIAKSNTTVFLTMENDTVYNYVGLPLLFLSDVIAVNNYYENQETTYQDRQSTMLVTIAAVVSSTLGFIILLTIIFGVILFNRRCMACHHSARISPESTGNPPLGNDRPSMRDLHNHIIPAVASKWWELGVQLLNPSTSHNILEIIKENHPQDVMGCCSNMLQRWLDTIPDASWNELLKALRSPSLQLNYLADQVECKLIKKFPTSPPQNVMVSSVTPSSLMVSWQPPPEIDHNVEITGYMIQFTRCGSNDISEIVTDGTEYTIPGLVASANYSVKVAAKNINGIGPFSNPQVQVSGSSGSTSPECSSLLAFYDRIVEIISAHCKRLVYLLSKYNVLTTDDEQLIASQHPTNNDMATTLLNMIVTPLQGKYKNNEEIFYVFLDVLEEHGEVHEVMLDISHQIREDCSNRMINSGLESYRGTYLWGKIKEHRLFLQYYSKLAKVTDTDYELIVPQHAEDINSLQKSSERAKKLLILINIDLKCKKTETFYLFLTCISNHNQHAVRKLAKTLNNLLQEDPQQACETR